jgi:hypothetical protein
MLSPRRYLCLAVLLSTAIAHAGEKKGEEKPAPQEESSDVQVQFANGSSVRLSVLHDKIEVQTRYGLLAVPLKEIQRIDFGVRLPAAVERKVDAAIAKLGSARHGDREAGERELLALAGQGYPALLKAVKHPDKEVSRRAGHVLGLLRERLPDKELRDREDDIIATPGFTIVGRIAPGTLKASSEYFGAVQLQLAQMRQLRSLRGSGEHDVVIDAARFGSAHGTWMDSGFASDGSTPLTIKASGFIDLYPQTPGQYMSSPNGINAGHGVAKGAQVVMNPRNLQNLAGALLGRVGENGSPFLVGDSYEGSPGEGRVFLHIVPSPWNNASTGSFQVKISAKQ